MARELKYRLKTGKSGEEQLDNLDKMFGMASREFLYQIGLQKGMQIADVGCGVGNLSLWLAEQVGSEGHVFAIDNSQEQLNIAKDRAMQRGVKNISFHLADVHDLSEFNGSFDICYCRWLLIHVSEPESAVSAMAKTVKEGGILACEVGDMRMNDYYPSFHAYKRFLEKTLQMQDELETDSSICFNILKIFHELADFNTPHIQLKQPVITDPTGLQSFPKQVAVLLASSSQALIEKNIMTAVEIEQLKTEILSHQASPGEWAILSRMTQIFAKSTKKSP